MKHIFFAFILGITLTGCGTVTENPDEGFDTFYEGSPEGSFEEISPEVEEEISSSPEGSFDFSGGNDKYQCTVTCQPR